MTDCRIYRGRPDEKVSCKWAIYRLPESMSAIDLEAVRSFYPYAGERHSPTKGRQGSCFSSTPHVNVSSPCCPSGLSQLCHWM